uniref:Uncharacterized protein n=1 Tax=Candidatus Kentrum sp. LFY TaxID=2126342 RepID=A0A450V6S9_9GAMM|nr:MAG: hypothetical protein BECKLFY1418A_GA0070994_11177 [Candidatus Kentron sp. LFY]
MFGNRYLRPRNHYRVHPVRVIPNRFIYRRSRKFEKLDGRNTSYRFDLERDIRWKDMAYTFLEDGEIETASLTYGQLDLRARAIAVRLREIRLIRVKRTWFYLWLVR